MILATAISGMPTPEICFSPGQLKRTILAWERYGDSVECRWIGHTTFQLRGAIFHWTMQQNLRHQCLGVRWCYDVQWGRYWGTNDTRQKI